jgi:large subunit ribosomal protein L20
MITAVIRADASAYRDRRLRKRDYRALWITRISAACQQRDMNYSQFMNGLKRAGIVLDRKMLSQLAINDPPAFDKLVTIARDKTQQQKAA